MIDIEKLKDNTDIARYLGKVGDEMFCRLPTGGLVVYQAKTKIPDSLTTGEIVKLNLSKESSDIVVGIEPLKRTEFPTSLVWQARLFSKR